MGVAGLELLHGCLRGTFLDNQISVKHLEATIFSTRPKIELCRAELRPEARTSRLSETLRRLPSAAQN